MVFVKTVILFSTAWAQNDYGYGTERYQNNTLHSYDETTATNPTIGDNHPSDPPTYKQPSINISQIEQFSQKFDEINEKIDQISSMLMMNMMHISSTNAAAA